MSLTRVPSAHEDGGGEYAGRGIFDDCGDVDGAGEMTAIENRAITTAGMGNYSAAAVWDVATRSKIQRRGGDKGGKHSSRSSFLAYDVVPPGCLSRRLDDASHSPQSSRRYKCDYISLL